MTEENVRLQREHDKALKTIKEMRKAQQGGGLLFNPVGLRGLA